MTIGVFFGSQSPEHEVSIITGQVIISELLNLGHSVVAVYITKNRQWCVQKLENPNQNSNSTNANSTISKQKKLENIDDSENSENQKEIQKLRTGLFSLKTFENLENNDWLEKSWQNWQLNPNKNDQNQLIFTKKTFWQTQKISIDAVIPALHGSFGEDGTIQGILEMIGVPFVGSSTLTSSLVMDKILTKIVAQNTGVPTTKFVFASALEIKNWQNLENSQNQTLLEKQDDQAPCWGSSIEITESSNTKSKQEFIQKIEKELGYPVFVKPPKLGSSIGITKAQNLEELSDAIEVCLYYDSKILVEKAVANLADLTCCVIEKSTNSPIVPEVATQVEPNFLPNLQASLAQESLFTQEMFSFEDKYLTEGGSQTGDNQKSIQIPAEIPAEITIQIQEYSKILFDKLSCSGIARFDFLLDKVSGQLYFSEVNPLPGNFYKHLWLASGVSFGDLLINLIQVAVENSNSQKNLTYNFSSNLIQIANSSKMGSKMGKSGKI